MSAFGIDVSESCICVFRESVSKREALDALIDKVAAFDRTEDKDSFLLAVYERESLMSTGIGGGVAIPHVRHKGVHQAALGVGISQYGIEYGALDGRPVNLIVLFAMPTGSDKKYLELLAQVMMSLKNPEFHKALTDCETPTDVRRVLAQGVPGDAVPAL